MNTWNPDVCVKINKYLKLPYRWYDPSTGVCNLKHVALESPSSKRVVVDRMVAAQSEINESQWNILKHWPLTSDQMRGLVTSQRDPKEWITRMQLPDVDRKSLQLLLSKHFGYLWNAMQRQDPEENVAAVAFFAAMETDAFKYGKNSGMSYADAKLEGLWIVQNPYFQWHDPGKKLPFLWDVRVLQSRLIEHPEYVGNQNCRIQKILMAFRNDPTLLGAMVRSWMHDRRFQHNTPTTCKENVADIQGKTVPMLITEFEKTKKPQGEKWVLSQLLRYTSHFNEEQWSNALNYIREEATDAMHTLPLSVCYFAPRDRFESLLQIQGFANYVALRIAEHGHAFENEIITKRTSAWRWRLDPQGENETLALADHIMANAQSSFSASDIVERHRVLKELNPQWTLHMTYKNVFNDVLQGQMPTVDFLESSKYDT